MYLIPWSLTSLQLPESSNEPMPTCPQALCLRTRQARKKSHGGGEDSYEVIHTLVIVSRRADIIDR
jgi:hypothetical protein